MSDRAAIGLDSSAFYGRLRQPGRNRRQFIGDVRPNRRSSQPPPVRTAYEQMGDIQAVQQGRRTQSTFPEPPVYAVPAVQPQSRSSRAQTAKHLHWPGKLQFGLVAMAIAVFILGIFSSLQTIKANRSAAAQVAALARRANNPANAAVGSVVPSATKPTAAAISNYIVAPNYPRYLKIPALGTNARVLQVGVTNTGALGTPPNVYDTAWYTGSAEPGQPGATLIDGHVSSWTAHGVFYGLNTLKSGDAIQIVRGDGTILNYQVVKTQIYSAKNVNMQAAISPINAGTPGLNLISCTGDVIPGTSQFNERIIIFAEQV